MFLLLGGYSISESLAMNNNNTITNSEMSHSTPGPFHSNGSTGGSSEEDYQRLDNSQSTPFYDSPSHGDFYPNMNNAPTEHKYRPPMMRVNSGKCREKFFCKFCNLEVFLNFKCIDLYLCVFIMTREAICLSG